jgi:hypothetical protein
VGEGEGAAWDLQGEVRSNPLHFIEDGDEIREAVCAVIWWGLGELDMRSDEKLSDQARVKKAIEWGATRWTWQRWQALGR